jgi:argonaute-like protein implicated in RNA metabolism and viral defense
VLDEHANLKEPDNPYLHSKAILLTNGIPVQEIRQSTLERPSLGLQYVFQNLAVALYAKMGGIPWTVDHGLTVDDEIVIGMGTAELSGSRFDHRQRHIGITTVFRGDGNYLLGNVSRECAYSEYPEVLRTSLRDVLKEIKERNAWRPGDTVRVVFHAFKPLKNAEAAEIVRASVDEVGREQTVEFAFLTVLYDHPFTLLDTAQQGRSAGHGKRKGVFVPERGLMCQLGRYTRLLCTNGPGLIKRVTSPLPSPVLVHLHPESTYRDLAYLTDQVLKFTALSWRSTLPAEKPVTIYYSELIAELLARLHAVPDWSPAVLNTKLRTSKWFL